MSFYFMDENHDVHAADDLSGMELDNYVVAFTFAAGELISTFLDYKTGLFRTFVPGRGFDTNYAAYTRAAMGHDVIVAAVRAGKDLTKVVLP